MASTQKASKSNFDKRAAAFIVDFTNPDSPRFGNASKAMQRNMKVTEETAKKQAYQLIRQERIRNEIARILENRGMGQEERSDVLIGLITQKLTRVTTMVGGDGKVSTVTAGPTFSDIIKAIDTLNRMDGTYTEQKSNSDQEKEEHRMLLRQIEREAKAAAKLRKENAEKQEGQEVEGATFNILDTDNGISKNETTDKNIENGNSCDGDGKD